MRGGTASTVDVGAARFSSAWPRPGFSLLAFSLLAFSAPPLSPFAPFPFTFSFSFSLAIVVGSRLYEYAVTSALILQIDRLTVCALRKANAHAATILRIVI